MRGGNEVDDRGRYEDRGRTQDQSRSDRGDREDPRSLRIMSTCQHVLIRQQRVLWGVTSQSRTSQLPPLLYRINRRRRLAGGSTRRVASGLVDDGDPGRDGRGRGG